MKSRYFRKIPPQNHAITQFTQNSREKRLVSRATFMQNYMQGWHWGLRKIHAKIKKENHMKMLVSWYCAKTQ